MRRQGRLGFWYRVGIAVLKPGTLAFTRREVVGPADLPAGAVIVAANHISYADPAVLCDFLLFAARRAPRFLAKQEMFRGGGLVARVMRGAAQIPVARGGQDASRALDAAVAALAAGEAVAIYPEGTVTSDPDRWPMRGRTGVARLALLSGAPVVPVAQWGAQEIHGGGSSGWHLLPPTRVRFRVGRPVDLEAFRGRELTADVLEQATEAVMRALTVELEVLRGETAPDRRHDPRGARPVGTQGPVATQSQDGHRSA